MASLKVEEHEAHGRRKLHQKPPEARAEVDSPSVRREASIGALHERGADEDEYDQAKREREDRVVRGVAGVPGHHLRERT